MEEHQTIGTQLILMAESAQRAANAAWRIADSLAMMEMRSQILDEKRIPIIDMYMSVRACKALHRLGVETLDQTCKLTEQKLVDQRNCGAKTIAEIKYRLSEHGLALLRQEGQ